MVYIILATISGVFMLILVRLFEKNNVHTFYALMFNYFSAFVCGILNSYLFIKTDNTSFFHILSGISKEVWLITVIEGILFITVLYWIAQTTKYYGITVASVANKMSLVFPVLSAYILFEETLSFTRWVGLFAAVVSVYLVTYSDSIKTFKNTGKIAFPLLVFLGSGIVDSLINYGNKTYVDTNIKQLVFSSFVYGFALITGFVYLKIDRKKVFYNENFNLKKTIIFGLLLGIPNFYNLFFIIQALNTKILPSGQIFLILNLSNVITSSIIGVVFFNEKLLWMNWLGIICAVVAILLIQ